MQTFDPSAFIKAVDDYLVAANYYHATQDWPPPAPNAIEQLVQRYRDDLHNALTNMEDKRKSLIDKGKALAAELATIERDTSLVFYIVNAAEARDHDQPKAVKEAWVNGKASLQAMALGQRMAGEQRDYSNHAETIIAGFDDVKRKGEEHAAEERRLQAEANAKAMLEAMEGRKPNGESKPAADLEPHFQQLAEAAGGKLTGRVLKIAKDTSLSADQKMAEIIRLDRQFQGHDSNQWGTLLQVSPPAIRGTATWKAIKAIERDRD